MGGSKQKTSTKPIYSKQIENAANTVGNVYNQQQPRIQEQAERFSGLSEDLLGRYMNGSDTIGAARDYNTSVLQGDYLGANPYLDDVIARGSNDTVNATQAALGLRGLTGGSDYAGIIADRVAGQSLGTRYADYDRERGRMANAAGQAPGLDLSVLAPGMSAGQLGATLPMQAAQGYGASVGGLLGPYTNQTTKQNPGLFGWAGLGLQGASLLSDARAKEGITRVGQTDGGLPVFTYRYKGEDTVHMGVMAQDVAEQQPEALGEPMGDYMTVNYGAVR